MMTFNTREKLPLIISGECGLTSNQPYVSSPNPKIPLLKFTLWLPTQVANLRAWLNLQMGASMLEALVLGLLRNQSEHQT